MAYDVQEQKEPIWNPNAAANWSLVFSPVFGAYLHMRNWRALGEERKATVAKMWFYASLVMLPVYIFVGLFAPDTEGGKHFTRALGFGFLAAWYFSSAREQSKYVKEKYGSDYDRKPWGITLLAGLGGMVAYFVVGMIVAVVTGATA